MPRVMRERQSQVGSSGSLNGGKFQENKTITTADATPTVIASLPLNQSEVAFARAMVIGHKADYSAGCGGDARASCRRASGNIALVGAAAANVVSDSTSTFAFSVNTTSQQLELKVTGVAAETWLWEVHFEGMKA